MFQNVIVSGRSENVLVWLPYPETIRQMSRKCSGQHSEIVLLNHTKFVWNLLLSSICPVFVYNFIYNEDRYENRDIFRTFTRHFLDIIRKHPDFSFLQFNFSQIYSLISV